MAVEIAKRIPPDMHDPHQQHPAIVSVAPFIQDHRDPQALGRLIPAGLLKMTAIVKHNLTMPGAQNKKIMRQVIHDGNNHHIHWGLNAVLEWKNDKPSARC